MGKQTRKPGGDRLELRPPHLELRHQVSEAAETTTKRQALLEG